MIGERELEAPLRAGGQGGMSAGVTAVVLAGGRSRRLGQDKALASFAGEPLLCRVIRRAAGAIGAGDDETVVVVGDAGRAGVLPLDEKRRWVADAFPGGGALGGIYTGVAAGGGEWSLVVACDMPFLSGRLLRYMAGQREGVDVVAPVIGGRAEPMHAFYSRRCLPVIRRRLERGELQISGFYDEVAVRYITEGEARQLDPELLSFFNINDAADLERARARAG